MEERAKHCACSFIEKQSMWLLSYKQWFRDSGGHFVPGGKEYNMTAAIFSSV